MGLLNMLDEHEYAKPKRQGIPKIILLILAVVSWPVGVLGEIYLTELYERHQLHERIESLLRLLTVEIKMPLLSILLLILSSQVYLIFFNKKQLLKGARWEDFKP